MLAEFSIQGNENKVKADHNSHYVVSLKSDPLKEGFTSDGFINAPSDKEN